MDSTIGKRFHVEVEGDAFVSFTATLVRWEEGEDDDIAIFSNGVGVYGTDFTLTEVREPGDTVPYRATLPYSLN